MGGWDFFIFGLGGGGFTLLSQGFFVLGLKFINICSTFTHSFTQFISCTVGKCKCWTVCFLCLGAIKHVA